MFDMLASKMGEAQAFADGLVNLDVLSMDRLRDEQERNEQSKEESLRLLRGGETSAGLDMLTTEEARSPPTRRAERKADIGDDVNVATFGDIETASRRSDPERLDYLPHGDFVARAGRRPSGSDEFASDAEGGNFEDEFDPILASIRKPPAAPSASPSTVGSTTSTIMPFHHGGGEAAEASPPSYNRGAEAAPSEEDKGASRAGPSFAAGIFSMFPDDMRTRAGDVMAQSSTRLSESLRSAFESGMPKTKGGRRRQSDPPTTDGLELVEEGGGGKGAGGRRTAGAEDEQDVRMVSVNELLSEEERQQLAALSGGGAAGVASYCGWRRVRKYSPVVAGIVLLGVIYLWRWTTLPTVADEANALNDVNAGRF